MKQQRYKGTKLSPEGREQPDFIFRYLDARASSGRAAPLEMWDCRNGWVHYRDEYGAHVALRKSQIERFTREMTP